MPKHIVKKSRAVSRSVNTSQPSGSRFFGSRPQVKHNMTDMAAEREWTRKKYLEQVAGVFGAIS
jgi:hypothetical protein